MVNWKEIAKFFAGVTLWESVVHASLELSGLLPLTILGFSLNRTINTMQIIIPLIVSVVLAYYAWIKK